VIEVACLHHTLDREALTHTVRCKTSVQRACDTVCHPEAYTMFLQVLLVLPMTSVENERHFSLMAFIKNNKRNRMLEPHLNICTRLFTCKHTFKTLPTEECLRQWLDPDGTQRVKRRKLYR